jgi:hypothetical protein
MRSRPILIGSKHPLSGLWFVLFPHKFRSAPLTSSLQRLARPKRNGVAKAGRASSLQKLIATDHPSRMVILSPPQAEEPKELSSEQTRKPKITAGKKANKRLIATVANSEFRLTYWNYRHFTISNRNSKHVSATAHSGRFAVRRSRIINHDSRITPQPSNTGRPVLQLKTEEQGRLETGGRGGAPEQVGSEKRKTE